MICSEIMMNNINSFVIMVWLFSFDANNDASAIMSDKDNKIKTKEK